MLPAVRISQYALESTAKHVPQLRRMVRLQSATLTQAGMECGLPQSIAEVCGGLLASMIDDLVCIGNLRHTDFERTRRKQRVLSLANEPALSGLRIAIAASPINGQAAVAHWDAICEKYERGKLAWLMGMETDTAYGYGKKIEKMQNSS
jgi:hypothetical protein